MKFYKSHNDRAWFIIATFILFWPLGIYLIYKHRKLSTKARGGIASAFIATTMLFGIAGYNAPPTLAFSNGAISTYQKTDNDYILIEGTVTSMHTTDLFINSKSVSISPTNKFSYRLPLKEGDTEVKIVAKSEKGTDVESFKVHRTTKAEFQERKRIADAQEAEGKRVAEENAKKAKAAAIKAMLTCDGKTIKSGCKLEGLVYKTYIYHPAVAEKTHTVTDITYKEVVTGYCTLCNDGTYSPTCATGRGACSWHGGVAQWNAPRISKVPVNTERVVVDSPAVAEYYEKVLDPAYN